MSRGWGFDTEIKETIMEEKELLEIIKKKSKESGIEYPNLIMYKVRFEIYRALSENPSGIKSIFLSEPVLREGIYQPKKDDSIRILLGEDDKKEDLMESFSDRIIEQGITVTSCDEIKEGYYLVLAVDRFRFEYRLIIQDVKSDNIYPVRKEASSVLDSKDTFEYYLYPVENQAIECILNIMKKLELINDLDIYSRLYKILNEESMDGLKLCRILASRCKETGFDPGRKKFEKFKSYNGYKFMANKWNRYMRVNRIKEPAWTDMHEMIVKFIEPLWEAANEETVFTGSWMPELGRYLG